MSASASPPTRHKLEAARCPLLKGEDADKDERLVLVERFNAVSDILANAAEALPQFRERAVVAQVRDELARLEKTMTKQRFRIGFIGPSQSGKSTTISNLLAIATDAEAPTPRGNGAPTTSVPTRIVPLPTASGGANAIRLCYYSRAELRERICDICDLLKLPYNEDASRLREAVRQQHAEKPYFKAADHLVLLRLLDAALKFPEVIRDEAHHTTGDYGQRRVYLTHQDEPSEYTLLREVQIDFLTDAIHPDVEMVDLPGLGVDKESDDLLTLSLVHTLDGAFMFQESTQLAAVEVAKLAERMRQQYARTLGERLWMVVTRCDSIDELGLEGPADEPNSRSVFCHLDSVLGRQGIKPTNVIFVGNVYYKAREAGKLKDAEPPSEALRRAYPVLLRFHDDGRVVTPGKCLKYPGQVEPWQQFVLSSGIPRLRDTMQTNVAAEIREQTRRDVRLQLSGIIDNLADALMSAEQQAGMSPEEIMQAAAWGGVLDRLSDEIGRDGVYSCDVAKAIEQTLGAEIGKFGRLDRGDLVAKHEQLAGLLSIAGLHAAEQQTERVLTLVQTRLEDQVRAQAPPDAAGLPKPLEHWAGGAKCLGRGETCDGCNFRKPIFMGFREDPSPFADGGLSMAAADYHRVMASKAARVARVYGSRLVHEIQSHLLLLQARYRAVATEIDHIDRDRREQYAKYRADLERLRN